MKFYNIIMIFGIGTFFLPGFVESQQTSSGAITPEMAHALKEMGGIMKGGNNAMKELFGIDLSGNPVAPSTNESASSDPVTSPQNGVDFPAAEEILKLIEKIEVKPTENSTTHSSLNVSGSMDTKARTRAETLTGVGSLALMLGDIDKAIEHLMNASTEDPGYPTAHYNLACAYARKGNTEHAVQSLKEAIALDSKYVALAEKDADFDSIRQEVEFQSALKS